MNIVVGVDGSSCSTIACDLVAATAWPADSYVRLVAACEAPLDGPDTDVPRDLAAALDEQAAWLRSRGLVTECVVRRGRAASVLLACATEMAADLIVVGSRGHGVAATALLGSVSATLADHAPCPVLVVRRPQIRRILFAADASESVQAIPLILGVWGAFTSLPVDVVTVAPSCAEARAIADSTAHRLTALGMRATSRVLVGNPAREIERVAADGDVDLIVTGSRGLGQLQRLLLGSVAHHVLLHARSSVLIMRGHVPARLREHEAERFALAM
ncbi:MAG: universal stress protein [Chloroflexota bacterium]